MYYPYLAPLLSETPVSNECTTTRQPIRDRNVDFVEHYTTYWRDVVPIVVSNVCGWSVPLIEPPADLEYVVKEIIANVVHRKEIQP